MLIKNKALLRGLITDLEGMLFKKKRQLFKLNKVITGDTDYWIAEDFNNAILYLRDYVKNFCRPEVIGKIKPKGKILIILSYNEPFILNIIPVLNALVTGNDVTLKPTFAARYFAEIIWLQSGLREKYGLKLKIISPNNHLGIKRYIRKVVAVYFFGSYKVARTLAKFCGDNYVEFYPEIETSDIKIFDNGASTVRRDAVLTLRESFSHSGQSCQRIQGIIVQKKNYDKYVLALKQEFSKICISENLNKYVGDRYAFVEREQLDVLNREIKRSDPTEIIKKSNLPMLVIGPKSSSEFTRNAYFYPILWINSFSKDEELIKILNSRRYYLGLNIQSNRNDLIEMLVSSTKFTRYTVNVPHIKIRSHEGWGGSWPSGSMGYRNWIEHFTNGYTVIRR